MSFAQLLAGLATAALCTALFQTWHHGRRVHTATTATQVATHRWWANCSIICVVGAVLIIEGIVLIAGPGTNRAILPYHLPFAITFVLLLLILRWAIPGTTHPHWHRRLAYTCLGCFMAALGTGGYLFLGH